MIIKASAGAAKNNLMVHCKRISFEAQDLEEAAILSKLFRHISNVLDEPEPTYTARIEKMLEKAIQ